jgi:hypothetical protein
MKDLIGQRNALLRKLAQCSEFVRGSITNVCATCHRARCICQKNSARKVYRLTYKDHQQKTRIVYVARCRLPRMRKMIANYARVRTLIEQLVETNVAVFREDGRR